MQIFYLRLGQLFGYFSFYENREPYLQPLDCLDHNLLLFDLPLHQHRPEVHPALHRHIELEGELDLAVIVAEDAPVVALVISPGLVAAQGHRVVLAVGPELVARLHGQVLEALEPLDLGDGVPLHGEGHEAVLPLVHGVLVRGADELRLGPTFGLKRRADGPLPVLRCTLSFKRCQRLFKFPTFLKTIFTSQLKLLIHYYYWAFKHSAVSPPKSRIQADYSPVWAPPLHLWELEDRLRTRPWGSRISSGHSS